MTEEIDDYDNEFVEDYDNYKEKLVNYYNAFFNYTKEHRCYT